VTRTTAYSAYLFLNSVVPFSWSNTPRRLHFPIMSRSALETSNSQGVRRPEREADQSSPSGIKINDVNSMRSDSVSL
jgi:hypothetical protein